MHFLKVDATALGTANVATPAAGKSFGQTAGFASEGTAPVVQHVQHRDHARRAHGASGHGQRAAAASRTKTASRS